MHDKFKDKVNSIRGKERTASIVPETFRDRSAGRDMSRSNDERERQNTANPVTQEKTNEQPEPEKKNNEEPAPKAEDEKETRRKVEKGTFGEEFRHSNGVTKVEEKEDAPDLKISQQK